MSRKAGTPNKPKVENNIVSYEDFHIDKPAIVAKKYILVEHKSIGLLVDDIISRINYGYVCQGGVSVTNYRGLDGKIVMVYCQALVRKE